MMAATDHLLATYDGMWPGQLTPAERERATAFQRSSDRRDYVAAHLLVRLCAANAISVAPATLSLVQRCPVCQGPHGRPTLLGLAGVHVSLSHAAGWVAAAVAGEPVGIDLEGASLDTPESALLDFVLTSTERDVVESADNPTMTFRQFWVRKEALLKVGYATLDTFRDLDLARLPLVDLSADASTEVRYGDLLLRYWSAHNGVVVGAAASTQKLHMVPWPRDLDPLCGDRP
jgi:4'-phosphopantetheinyl transferase